MTQILKTAHNILNLKNLHFSGVFLCVAIFLIPSARVLLYPFASTHWQELLFHILISLVEILFLVSVFLNRRQFGYSLTHIPAVLWGAFIIWGAAVLYNIPSMALMSGGIIVTIQFFMHLFFFIGLSAYLSRQPAAGASIIISVLLSVLIFLPLFWIKLYFTYTLTTFNWSWSLPGFGNVRHLDYFLASLVTLFGLLPITRNIKEQSTISSGFIYILLFCLWVMIFWSGGRGSAIAAVSSIALILLFLRPFQWHKIMMINFIILGLAAAASTLLPSPNSSYGILRFMTKITQVDSFNAFSAGRLQIWTESLHLWFSHIWFGVGAGQTKTLIQSASGVFGQPHNVIIQALLAWGIIGGIPFLGAIGGSLWCKGIYLFQTPLQNKSCQVLAFGLALSIAINALVDGTLYYPFPVFLFIIGISVAHYSSKSHL